MLLSFFQQISYEFVYQSSISLISPEIPFRFNCKVSTENILGLSSHCAIGIEVYNLSCDMFPPNEFVWYFQILSSIFYCVSSQENYNMSALLLAYCNIQQLTR